MTTETDRIEKKVLLRASRARVWKALADSREFGTWFGVKFDAPFVAGVAMRGTVQATQADPEIGKLQEPHVGLPFEITVERLDPEKHFSFRWHPFAIERGVDYSGEPTTLVAFELADAPGGVLLTVTETGFDRIPLARRAKAFAANDHGWALQMGLIEKYLGQTG